MGDLTNKMGLATWDQPLDPYNYQQLSNNWQILDFHDHSPGRGVQINSLGIAAGAIRSSNIAGGAITPALVSGGVLGFAPSVASSNLTANLGTYIEAAPSITVTLPSPSALGCIGIIASSSVTGATPVTVSGTNIQGEGMVSATSFTMGFPGGSVVLLSDGTNWQMIAGARDSGWINLSLLNSWAAYTTDGFTPAYRRRGNTVSLRGCLNSTSATNTPVANLPSGYYPTGGVPCVFSMVGDAGSPPATGTAFTMMVLSGVIYSRVNTGPYQYLEGIHYDVS